MISRLCNNFTEKEQEQMSFFCIQDTKGPCPKFCLLPFLAKVPLIRTTRGRKQTKEKRWIGTDWVRCTHYKQQ